MKSYTETEIKSLVQRFEERRLPKSEWTHEAHLIVAVWYCCHHDQDAALSLVRELIIGHNDSVGTPNTDTEGYHESITRFWILVASDFIACHQTGRIEEVCNSFITSQRARKDYPLQYYSPECLFTVTARKNWVEPDRRSLF